MKSTTDLIELVRRLRLIGKYDAAAEAADYLESLSASPTPPAQPAERRPLSEVDERTQDDSLDAAVDSIYGITAAAPKQEPGA